MKYSFVVIPGSHNTPHIKKLLWPGYQTTYVIVYLITILMSFYMNSSQTAGRCPVAEPHLRLVHIL